MAVTNDVQSQVYNGSLLALNLLSGNATNLVLNALGSTTQTSVTENNNVLQVGETVLLGTGQGMTVLGSGTAQPGVNLFGLTVPTGTARAVVLVRDNATGDLHFLYPDGAPNLLGAVAMVVRMTPTDYGFPGGVLCFAAGTAIATPRGPRPVEHLRRGQRVATADNGFRRILWHAVRHLPATALRACPRLWPVRFPAGALGDGRPARPLLLSPQHRVLVRPASAGPRFGGAEVLVAAVHLVGHSGISRVCPEAGVTYHHLLLARHELLWAEGAACESLFTGPEAIRALDPAARAELQALFPDLPAADPVRPMLDGRDWRPISRAMARRREVLSG